MGNHKNYLKNYVKYIPINKKLLTIDIFIKLVDNTLNILEKYTL